MPDDSTCAPRDLASVRAAVSLLCFAIGTAVLVWSAVATARNEPRPRRAITHRRPVDASSFAARPDPFATAPDVHVVGPAMSFCGGGGSSVVAQMSRELARVGPEHARSLVAHELRAGHVEPWERADALLVLAEAQLASGDPSRAAVNYRRALALDPEIAPTARVGLATALYLLGERRAARVEARHATAAACGSPSYLVACYAASRIVALTERDPAARDAALAALSRLRAAYPNAELERTDRRLAAR